MKILFITTGLTTGGAEIALLKIVSGLKVKHHIEVVSLRNKGDIGPKLEELGIKVTELNLSKNPLSLFKLFKLIRIIKAFNPDVVQTWMYHADLIGGIAAKIAGVRNIVWGIRNSDLNPKRVSQLTILTARLCAALSGILPIKILTNSQQAQDAHIKLGYRKSKFSVIPNGFDLKVFYKDEEKRREIRNNLSVSSTDKVIGMIGRFDPQKNHLGFIKCATMILDQEPKVKFILIGEGVTLENRIITNAIPEHLRANFILAGLRQDIPNILNGIDVLALPSFGEAFPNVVGEAMACEKPCVCTNVGDSKLLIGDTGHIVEIGNMVDMANKLISLLKSSEKELKDLGQIARTRIKENFDIDIKNAQLEIFYKEISQNQI